MNESSDDRQHQPVVADAETCAAQAVPERNNPPVAAATESHPPCDQSLDAPSEHLADAVELALRLQRIERSGWCGFWLPGYWSFLFFITLFRKGFDTALIELWSRIIRWERQHPRGGNTDDDPSPPYRNLGQRLCSGQGRHRDGLDRHFSPH